MEIEDDETRVRKIRLLGVGGHDVGFMRGVAARLSHRLPVPCGLVESDLADSLPWIAGRKQVDADRLLATLESMSSSEGELLVCLCAHDIGNRVFSFFFGRARLHGPAALISTARLDPAFYGMDADELLFHERIQRELLHELGHNAGLQHCDDQECVMHFSADVESIDLRGRDYCADCVSIIDRHFESE